LCRRFLKKYEIVIGAHIYSIEKEFDMPFDPCLVSREELLSIKEKPFSVLSDGAGERMIAAVLEAKKEGDSVGGVIECAAVGLPAGTGSPIFGGIEPVLSSVLFSIPAVKGVEFGAGFEIAEMRGSKANDPFSIDCEKIICTENSNGGILGGITDGMPLIFRTAIKPTPSIALPQQSVDIKKMSQAEIRVPGRHDACIVPRAVCAVEAACAIALTDVFLEARGYA
jgi:chorismate synthase